LTGTKRGWVHAGLCGALCSELLPFACAVEYFDVGGRYGDPRLCGACGSCSLPDWNKYGTTQKPLGYTMVVLMCLILAHLLCFLSLFFVISDAPEFLIIMRGAITEGCRPNSSLQPSIFVLKRYHFYTIFT
jgi:hypothetical protein